MTAPDLIVAKGIRSPEMIADAVFGPDDTIIVPTQALFSLVLQAYRGAVLVNQEGNAQEFVFSGGGLAD